MEATIDNKVKLKPTTPAGPPEYGVVRTEHRGLVERVLRTFFCALLLADSKLTSATWCRAIRRVRLIYPVGQVVVQDQEYREGGRFDELKPRYLATWH